ncbi:MAG TPA: NAD(P)-dependent oxidoreductase [Candidatus Baltobacteraceae bacterium]|nr:NAD(P)-dependent oxidoreductase [Candidatus Baltobacteraceae bacterium]
MQPRPAVWIPADAPGAARARLGRLAHVDEMPAPGARPEGRTRADIVVVGDTPPAATAFFAGIQGLQVIQALSAGVDSLVGHVPAGVTLCDAAGAYDDAVAEWVLMAILAARRGLPSYVDAQRAATWRRSGRVGASDELTGGTALILGYGSIGRAVERRLAACGMKVLRVARHARPGVATMADVPELLPQAAVVVLLVPLTEATRGLVDRRFLAAMAPGALLVNAARGALVDTTALLRELTSGRLRAALDVTDPEPLPDGHPLWSAPGVIITPHVAGATEQSRLRAWSIAAAQVSRYRRGVPLRNVVSDGY